MITIDRERLLAVKDGVDVRLTRQEWRVLAALVARDGGPVSTGELESLLGYDGASNPQAAKVFVSRIRRKLGYDVIITNHGLGYRFNPKVAA